MKVMCEEIHKRKKWEKPWEMLIFRWWGKKADRAGPVWWNKLVSDREFKGGHGTQKALHKPSWTKEWVEFYKGMKVIKVKIQSCPENREVKKKRHLGSAVQRFKRLFFHSDQRFRRGYGRGSLGKHKPVSGWEAKLRSWRYKNRGLSHGS